MGLAGNRETRTSPLVVGIGVWLASEAMLFAGLFAAYFTLAAANEVWPPPGADIGVLRAGIFTSILVISSFTMQLAVHEGIAARKAASYRWLATTGVLGAVFGANVVVDLATLDFGLRSHAYGSIFFMIIGIHIIHLVAGIGLLAAVVGLTAGVRTRMVLAPTITVVSYYWHWVVAVSVAVFVVLYMVQ